jgi:hypothetical protein
VKQLAPALGERFGRLLVTHDSGWEPKQRDRRVTCVCDCGAVKAIFLRSLRRGITVSCGCFNRERVAATFTKHGLSKTTEYFSWNAMLSRCRDARNDSYENYGGRGIRVCERWHSFEKFLADMGKKPAVGYTIERIDNALGYMPGNCRWATPTEQGRNRRNNSIIEMNGERRPVSEWGEVLHINPASIATRKRRGVTDPMKLLAQPRRLSRG